MSHAWLSDTHAPLAREAALGLKAMGWTLDGGTDADVRVEFLDADTLPSANFQAGDRESSVVLVAPATTRLYLSELSLKVQGLAIAQAPARRINAIVVEAAQADRLAFTINWLAGAQMVTGQIILLSDKPAPTLL
ncbi:MAG: hypothetical protein JJE34_10095 [Alphaproteobacteria bacterium]|nr:hypothetical protein [Alphaproteobacteria bacterium]